MGIRGGETKVSISLDFHINSRSLIKLLIIWEQKFSVLTAETKLESRKK